MSVEHTQGGITIKDSGERRVFATGANRDRGDSKGAFAWMPYQALQEIAQVFEVGGKKYTPNNWRLGMPLSEYINSAARHLFKAAEGWDDENHIAMCGWNCMTFIATRKMIADGHLPAELNDIPNFLTKEGIENTFAGIRAANSNRLAQIAAGDIANVAANSKGAAAREVFGEAAGKSAETLVASGMPRLEPYPGSYGTTDEMAVRDNDTFYNRPTDTATIQGININIETKDADSFLNSLPAVNEDHCEPTEFAKEARRTQLFKTVADVRATSMNDVDKDHIIEGILLKEGVANNIEAMANAFPATSQSELGLALDTIIQWAHTDPDEKVGYVVANAIGGLIVQGGVEGIGSQGGAMERTNLVRKVLEQVTESLPEETVAVEAPTPVQPKKVGILSRMKFWNRK